ncbi:meprin A subunit beta-like [Babylonia areolata]|uniref:meprin A subunit beta-like n=1 Tax=Babylonia areolata TaxID=304850 RepID=UPI003FD66F7C
MAVITNRQYREKLKEKGVTVANDLTRKQASVVAEARKEGKVAYFKRETVDDPEISEGYFEGDIDLNMLRNAVRNPLRKWPDGIVYYVISSAFPSTTRATIIEAMREIESDTKHGSSYCVRFVQRTTQHDYVYIQKNTGCHSKIGRQGGSQELSLGTGCEGKGTIMHELNHALGFWHEQNRYDRDTYVIIHTDNIAAAHQHDFSKHSSHDMTTLGTPYDFGSIMHYGAYTFAVDKSKPSMSPRPGHATGVTMGQRLAMSVQDVARIQKLYQCPVDSIVNCNFDQDMCGLSQDSHDNFNWERKAGHTSTSNTGPNADHTNSAGYYIYAEANGHHRQTARLLSSTVSAGHYCLDFWLFQHGAQEGSFQIRAAGSRIREQAVKTVSGNLDNAWRHYRINLNVPADFHIVLQANMGYGDLADIAIDDFSFYQGRCL